MIYITIILKECTALLMINILMNLLLQLLVCIHSGEIRMVKGYLQSKGVGVQWKRVRQSLLCTDPIGLVERWTQTIKQQQYNVKYSLSLSHIDGKHKLIR